MKKITIALLGGGAMAGAVAAAYFFSDGAIDRGVIFGCIGAIFLWFLVSRMRADQRKAAKTAYDFEHPAINLAFYGELSRLIDEGKDINGYLRGCDAPQNIIKSVNIGGATAWYYHKDGAPFDEFCAEFPPGEAPTLKHPNLRDQRVEQLDGKDLHIITVDLYSALWDWGELHPKKRRYSNSMRIAFHGAYQPNGETGGNSYLDMTVEEVRAARKANKKKPKKKRNLSNI